MIDAVRCNALQCIRSTPSPGLRKSSLGSHRIALHCIALHPLIEDDDGDERWRSGLTGIRAPDGAICCHGQYQYCRYHGSLTRWTWFRVCRALFALAILGRAHDAISKLRKPPCWRGFNAGAAGAAAARLSADHAQGLFRFRIAIQFGAGVGIIFGMNQMLKVCTASYPVLG